MHGLYWTNEMTKLHFCPSTGKGRLQNLPYPGLTLRHECSGQATNLCPIAYWFRNRDTHSFVILIVIVILIDIEKIQIDHDHDYAYEYD